MWLTLDISKPFCTSKLRWNWSNEGTSGLCLFFFFWVVFFRNWQHVVVEVWSCNSAWTTDSQQYVLKSCTIAKRVFYPGTRTLFFCTAGPIPETFSFIVNLLFKLCFSHLKKICLWHNLPQIHSKLYICFPIKKLQFTQKKRRRTERFQISYLSFHFKK